MSDPVTEQAKAHPLISGAQPVAVMAGDAPRFPVQRPGGHEALLRDIKAMGLRHEETEGSYGAPEKSVIIYGPRKEQVAALGKMYGQESVLYSDHTGKQLLYTNGPNEGKAHPGLPDYDFWHEQPPEDYFTKLPDTGYVRFGFDENKLEDSMPAQHSEGRTYPVESFQKSVGGSSRSWYGACPWHEGHRSDHHKVLGNGHGVLRSASLAKADLPVPPPPPVGIKNDQAAGAGVSTFHSVMHPYGTVEKGKKTDLVFYPLHGKLPEIQKLVADHGFQVKYFGGKYGRPDLVKHNYTTGHLQIHDPTPKSGGDLGDRDLTDAWRQSHELAHAMTHGEVNRIYSEGRRLGKLGTHRTLNEALRAVHWEDLAAHKQRELLGGLGVHISDDAFNKERNTVLGDAVHRAIHGTFLEPSDEGFSPHSHHIPLEVSLNAVRDAARRMGLVGDHDILRKSDNAAILNEFQGANTVSNFSQKDLDQLRKGTIEVLKKAVAQREQELLELRKKELSKAEKCLLCSESGKCSCIRSLEKSDYCDRCGDSPLWCSCPPKEKEAKPKEKEAKQVKVKDTGSGKIARMGRKLSKTGMAVPEAKPPTKNPASPPAIAKSENQKMMDRLDRIAFNLAKSELTKAIPRLGGKDPASQQMTQHAAMAAPKAAAPAPAAAPKLSPADQSRRQAELADFTPAGAFSASGKGSALGGELKPPAKPMGTAAMPQPKLLDRFRSALKGQKMGKAEMPESEPKEAEAEKTEMSAGAGPVAAPMDLPKGGW